MFLETLAALGVAQIANGVKEALFDEVEEAPQKERDYGQYGYNYNRVTNNQSIERDPYDRVCPSNNPKEIERFYREKRRRQKANPENFRDLNPNAKNQYYSEEKRGKYCD